MRRYTLQTAAACPIGTKLDGYVNVLVKKVWKRKHGESAHGEWSLQDVICEDDTLNEFKITFSGWHELPRSLEGAELTLEATEGKKGYSGLIVSEYKEEVFLKVTEFALVHANGEQIMNRPQAPQGQQRPQERQQTQQRQQAPQGQQRPQERQQTQQRQQAPQGQQRPQERPQERQHATAPASELKGLRMALASYMTVYRFCYDAAAALAADIKVRHNHILPSGTIGIVADKFFIEAARGGFCRSVPFVALDQMPPLRSLSVGEMMRELETVIADFKGREAAHVAARQTKPEEAATAPQERQQAPQGQQRPQSAKLQPVEDEASYQEGMTDDEIPF